MDLHDSAHTLGEAHQYLHMWAIKYVSHAGACRVASIAMGRLFQLATVLWDTQQGPWAELLDLAVPTMLRQALAEGVTHLGPVESHPYIPTDDFLKRLANLYAMIYMAAQFGNWSFVEREEIARALRMQHHYPPWPDQAENWLFSIKLGAVPLRRAVQALERHECGGDLVCDAASEAERYEAEIGLRWAAEARRLEGAEV